MVIYHYEHFGGFAQLLTLRLTKHREEQAILVGCDIADRMRLVENLLEAKLFNYVISYPYGLAFLENTEEQVVKVISACFDKKLSDINVDVKNASKIYTYDDVHNAFAIYLNNKNIDYTWIEPKRFTSTETNFTKHFVRCEIRYHEGIISESYCQQYKASSPMDSDFSCKKSIVIYPNTPIYDCDFIERFDFDKKLFDISSSDKKRVLACFNLHMDDFMSKKLSLLVANSDDMSAFYIRKNYILDNHIQSITPKNNVIYSPQQITDLYTVILDYFLLDDVELMYKQHPYAVVDFGSIIKENFGACIIDGDMPIELILLIPEIKIKQVLSLLTSATAKIEEFVEENMELGLNFTTVYFFFNRLHAIMKLALDSTKRGKVYYYGIAEDAINASSNFLFREKSGRLIKIDELPVFDGENTYIINTSVTESLALIAKDVLIERMKNASMNSIVFFTNSIDDYCFCDLMNPELLNNILPVLIKRISDKEVVSFERFYVFTKNPNTQRKLRGFRLEKKLKYSKMKLVIEPLSDEEIYNERMNCFYNTVKVEMQRKAFSAANDNLKKELDWRISESDSSWDNLNNQIWEKDGTISELSNWKTYHESNPLWKHALLLIRAGIFLRKMKEKLKSK